jgi:hypothetical protein
MAQRNGQLGLKAFLKFTGQREPCRNDNQAARARGKFEPRRAAARFTGFHAVAV